MSDDRQLAGDTHDAQPVVGSWTRKSDGAPADLFESKDYPLVAICMTCERPIYAESFVSRWEHGELPKTPVRTIT